MFSEKRAITPVIATLLLIAITVAAVAGFYIFYNNFIRQQNVGAKAPSISVSGPNNAGQGDVITVTIKNTGNVNVTIATGGLVLNPTGSITWSTANWWARTLGPGQIISGSGTLGPTTLTPRRWEITVTATTTGGSSVQDALVIMQA